MIKDFKHNWGFEIVWKCGHRYKNWNTTQNPNKDKKALKYGCAYCDCKDGKLRTFKMLTKFNQKKEGIKIPSSYSK